MRPNVKLDPDITAAVFTGRSGLSTARCVACQGVRSRPVPVALVGECSIPVV